MYTTMSDFFNRFSPLPLVCTDSTFLQFFSLLFLFLFLLRISDLRGNGIVARGAGTEVRIAIVAAVVDRSATIAVHGAA